MKSLWLYLHFTHLQLDCLCATHGTDSAESLSSQHCMSKPVVILDAKSNSILQLNQAAIEAGIQRGMGLGTAAALSQHLQVVPYNGEVEQKKLTEIAEHLYLVTSDICLLPANGILLRIHNMLSLYGGLNEYWHAIKNQLNDFPVKYHFATGQSPFAAKILACTGWDQICDHLPMLQHQIGLRKLSDSELDSKTVNKLSRVGVHCIADLMAISLKEIAKRFENDLVTYLGRLRGDFHHPIVFFHPKTRFTQYLELLYEISHTDTLLRPMIKMLDALEQFLKVRDLLTQKIVFTLYQRDAEILTLEVGSAQGEYLSSRWHALAALKIENLRLKSPVYGLELYTGATEQRCPDKADLFTARRGALSYLQLISMLQAKLGEQAVKQIQLDNDHRPDRVNRYVSPSNQLFPHNRHLQGMRPSFLLAPCLALTEAVKILHGPERIATGWWDNKVMTRDYFIARNNQGQWLWIFRTPCAKWYVHGLFS
ncbi:DNA polymerase Y family protein [Aliiglaciecola sp. LCG003]|uniref:Y-family DNA polymerase n=1 Tax=Aliiglaciecola sp. LCG003 TaxID=3053655 RepID=UPI002573D05B|nr:DNA polymerase Y family protein [Aliiglaciecola sp. LCG003]WJG09494.1 DNA polymerase Y family protein [Aliiglaciecola sp. LCG003]